MNFEVESYSPQPRQRKMDPEAAVVANWRETHTDSKLACVCSGERGPAQGTGHPVASLSAAGPPLALQASPRPGDGHTPGTGG